MEKNDSDYAHFKGKDALGHVIEAHREGIFDQAEMHGLEISGFFSAFADSMRETALFFMLFLLVIPAGLAWSSWAAIAFAWAVWKAGRSGWLGWARLERLHRIVKEERWEIEHNRPQEREELKVLYNAKGFQGKLLDDVVDVLMADGDRLLKVMLEEELGLTLESQEHPLKQAIGSFLGASLASLFVLPIYFGYSLEGGLLGALVALIISAILSARISKNRLLESIVWHLGLAALSVGSLYLLVKGVERV